MTTDRSSDHRTITPQEVEQQLAGGTTIAPGVWIDADGHTHYSIPDLLTHLGLPDTPEYRESMVAALRKFLADHGVAEVIVQSVKDA